jgi:hypothetical protein
VTAILTLAVLRRRDLFARLRSSVASGIRLR